MVVGGLPENGLPLSFPCPKTTKFQIQELLRLLADSKTCPPTGGFKNLSAYWRNLSGF